MLAVCWAMPPLLLPRAIQVSRLLRELRQSGWDTTVITAKLAKPLEGIIEDPELMNGYADAYRTILVPFGGPLSLFERFRSARSADASDEHRWKRDATRRALAFLKRRPADVLVTFAQPWFDHRVGQAIKEESKLPWVAHFSDPWVDSPYYDCLPDAERRRWADEEHAVIAEADAVVFTTAETATLVMKKYPAEWKSKASVVPHGVTPASGPASLRQRVGTTPLRIVHAGDFYEGKRTPTGLFRALRDLHLRHDLRGRLELILIGIVPGAHRREVRENGLESIVECRGKLPYHAVQEAAAEADVLLVVDAPAEQSVFLPSKLVDYLAFRKPILGLTPRAGASAALLTRLGCPIAPPDDPAAISAIIDGLLAAHERGALDISPQFDAVARDYDIRTTATQFHEILSRVAGAAHAHGRGASRANT
jgi:glycosyltransferase involved in cell wall biosynthesis